EAKFGSARGPLRTGTADLEIPAPPQSDASKINTVSTQYELLDKYLVVKGVASRENLELIFADPRLEQGALIYIHGFNTTFIEALRATARLAYEVRSPSLPITFSWPSSGIAYAYFQDQDSARFGGQGFAQLIKSVSLARLGVRS